MVVANPNPVHGAEPDSGTVLELGFGFAQGEKVWGYVVSEDFRLTHDLMLAVPAKMVVGGLEDCLKPAKTRRPALRGAGDSAHHHSIA